MLLVPSFIISSDGFFKALYPLIFFVFLIYHYRRFFWLSLPIYLLTPFALYYEITYNAPTEISVWLTILGSSTTEGRVFIDTRYSFSNWFDYCLYHSFGLLLSFYSKSKTKHSNMGTYFSFMSFFSPIQRYLKAPDHQQGFLNVYRHFKQSYPLNLVLGLPAASLEVNRVKDFIATQTKLSAHKLKKLDLPLQYWLLGKVLDAIV